MDRNKTIIRTSFVGIGVNAVLVAFKAAIGFISGSIAIVLDAVNNLSDALSSVITIVGTKLSSRAPDKKHPYGHGRIEYLTSMLIAIIMLVAGAASIRESVEKIIAPTKATYSAVSIIVIVAAIAAKLLCGRYVRSVGKRINSGALIASGSDALFDAVLSFGTLVAAIISLIFGLSLEGWFGAVISVFIIKAGIEMLMEPLNIIIGTRVDDELSENLKKLICDYPGVFGAYDLVLHNYGHNRMIGSVHIEVADDLHASDIHKLTRHISEDVFTQFGILLTVGIYATNDSDDEIAAIKKDVLNAVKRDEIIQMHGFYGDSDQKRIMFDIVVDFKNDANEVCSQIKKELTSLHPDYTFDIVLDSDFSD